MGGLTDKDLSRLKEWRDFYSDSAQYTKVGKLSGRFYNGEGKRQEPLTLVLAAAKRVNKVLLPPSPVQPIQHYWV